MVLAFREVKPGKTCMKCSFADVNTPYFKGRLQLQEPVWSIARGWWQFNISGELELLCGKALLIYAGTDGGPLSLLSFIEKEDVNLIPGEKKRISISGVVKNYHLRKNTPLELQIFMTLEDGLITSERIHFSEVSVSPGAAS